MLSSRALARLAVRSSLPRSTRLSSTSARDSDRIPTNDPNPKPAKHNVSATNELPVSKMGHESGYMVEPVAEAEKQRSMQAPNRTGIWSRSQNPRARAMTGPRFEQTIMEYQPQPQAAIELIHKQPVRWTDERVVACDGGGGPLGHPRIFINVDKPQICACTYCGVPYANNHHKAHLQSLPSTSYPLAPTNDPATVTDPERIPNEPYNQR